MAWIQKSWPVLVLCVLGLCSVALAADNADRQKQLDKYQKDIFGDGDKKAERSSKTLPVDSNEIKKPLGKGPFLVVANKHSDTLSYIDPVTYEILDTIATGPNPHEIIITPDGRYAYLSNYASPGNTISVIDLPARKHIKQIPTGQATRIHGAAITSDGKQAYFTAGQTGLVVEVDTNRHEVTRTIPTEGKISHMVLVSPDDKLLYTANIVSEDVSVIDRNSGKLIQKIPCGKGAEGIAFTPDGKRLWVANQAAGTMTVIDRTTHKPIKTFECDNMPVRIYFIKNGQLALVPCWSEKGQVLVIDVASHKVIKRIGVGSYAIGITTSPDGKKAFVGCEHKDGVHVIDLDKMAVEAIIKTGDGPDPMMIWYPPKK
jgi:YVTN family beta-propeller protein